MAGEAPRGREAQAVPLVFEEVAVAVEVEEDGGVFAVQSLLDEGADLEHEEVDIWLRANGEEAGVEKEVGSGVSPRLHRYRIL